MPNMDENEFDAVVDVAAAACRGDMLQWLETHAGLYNAASRQGGDQWRHYINEELAAAAARSGHVSLLRLLLARLPQPSAGSGASRWSRLLRDVALGCPLPVPRRELAPASGGSCWSRDRRSRVRPWRTRYHIRWRRRHPAARARQPHARLPGQGGMAVVAAARAAAGGGHGRARRATPGCIIVALATIGQPRGPTTSSA